jgi:hypothetical protein
MTVKLGEVVRFQGRCDASGGFALNATSWVGGDDETNKLALYQAEGSRGEVILDLSEFLGLGEKEEADLESATRIGSRVYWIGSHSTKADGTAQPGRRRLFAVDVKSGGPNLEIVPAGTPFCGLIEAMSEEPAYEDLDLRVASQRGSNFDGALNIESICATPDGELMIGFRNPVPGGKALIAVLSNPDGVLAGNKPQLRAPLFIDLRGLGLRDMTRWLNKYLLIAGDFRDAHDTGWLPSQLFLWDGPGSKPEPLQIELPKAFNPEALITFLSDDCERVLVCSDDGEFACAVDGTLCKKLKKERKGERQFRAVWLSCEQGN